jgi:2-polyprenyl-3-methyl-5-hydroxy-6-metoxy-1,4-benzoquinol methylase
MSDLINPKSQIPNPTRGQNAELSGAKSENWYSSWFDTPYYHILYKDRNYREAQLFMDNLTHYLNLPEKAKVLDLACGKGRHAIYLNQLGFDVVGADLSVVAEILLKE